MDDFDTFERRVAAEVVLGMGSSEPVDDLAILGSITAATASQGRRSTMLSVVKFAAAAAIVVLFGGFLAAGVLTPEPGDEAAPAATTDSPSPMMSGEALRGLVTEEVEPGVFRVLDDGVGDLVYEREGDWQWRFPDLVAGHDGGIWILTRSGFYRLGESHLVRLSEDRDQHVARMRHEWPDPEPRSLDDFEVAADGTVWAAFGSSLVPDTLEDGEQGMVPVTVVHSLEEEGWTVQMPTTPLPDPIEVAPDGTVWALWGDAGDLGDAEQQTVGFLADGEWQSVDRWPRFGGLQLSGTGDIWALGAGGPWVSGPLRFADGEWHSHAELLYGGDAGPDGTFWGTGADYTLVRFDGSEWKTWAPPDWMPIDADVRMLADGDWVTVGEDPPNEVWEQEVVIYALAADRWGELNAAPDGTVWLAPRLGHRGGNNDPVCAEGVGGVVRFDGVDWTHYLQDHCVEAIDVAADGSVWLLAARSDARFPLLRTYVITPQAIEGTG